MVELTYLSLKKTTFFVHIFDISQCVFTQISIWFRIQRALPPENWVKTEGDMSKIRTRKVVLFYDKYVNSTIMIDSFYWNSIGSWISTHKNLLLARFLIWPILDPKFPLMHTLHARVSSTSECRSCQQLNARPIVHKDSS